MKVLIIEDELPAARRLKSILSKINPDYEILDVIDSAQHAIKWFNTFSSPDLVFMDIQLADGISFEIFEAVSIECPVIFTTAYDQYAIKAFKHNSVDYLLKPITQEDLSSSIEKFQKYHTQGEKETNYAKINEVIQRLSSKKNYRSRFLIKKGEQLLYVSIDEVAYFYSENSLTFLISKDKQRYIIDHSLEELEQQLDPTLFHRINRKQIICIQAIQSISRYFNGRLKIDCKPECKDDMIVSRERVASFKEWLNQ